MLERCVYDGEGSLCPSVQFWCPALSPVARWSPLLNLVRTDEGFKSSSERPVPHYICGPRFSLAPHRHHGLGRYLELLLCTRNTHPPSTMLKTFLFLPQLQPTALSRSSSASRSSTPARSRPSSTPRPLRASPHRPSFKSSPSLPGLPWPARTSRPSSPSSSSTSPRS